MRIKWLCSYHHGGRLYEKGDVCDVPEEYGAGAVKHGRAVAVDGEKRIADVEVAAVEPRAEKSVTRRGRPRKSQ